MFNIISYWEPPSAGGAASAAGGAAAGASEKPLNYSKMLPISIKAYSN